MTIASECIIRYPALRTDTATGGGRMSKNAVAAVIASPTDAVPSQAMLRDWTLAEAQSGGTQLRKFFLHVTNLDNDGLGQVGLILEAPTVADDRVTYFAGTPSDTVGDLPASPQEYGAGKLQASAVAGATGFVALLEDAALAIFRTGDTIFVSDGVYDERHDNVTIEQAGAAVTVTLAAGDQLFREYAAGATVASVLPLGTIQAGIDAPTISTVDGTIDAAQLVPDALGGIDQGITLTFITPTTFSAVSDVKGALGSGSISAAFAPINPDFVRPYFTLPATAWGGVWAAGQIVRFETRSATAAFWLRGRLPAGAAPTSNVTAQRINWRFVASSI